jgi:transcriptional regulator with XRE-family HTH domain
LQQVGRRVRLHRLVARQTQQQLGDAAGISRLFVSLIEKGAHDCSVLRLWPIADVLGVPVV